MNFSLPMIGMLCPKPIFSVYGKVSNAIKHHSAYFDANNGTQDSEQEKDNAAACQPGQIDKVSQNAELFVKVSRE